MHNNQPFGCTTATLGSWTKAAKWAASAFAYTQFLNRPFPLPLTYRLSNSTFNSFTKSRLSVVKLNRGGAGQPSSTIDVTPNNVSAVGPAQVLILTREIATIFTLKWTDAKLEFISTTIPHAFTVNNNLPKTSKAAHFVT